MSEHELLCKKLAAYRQAQRDFDSKIVIFANAFTREFVTFLGCPSYFDELGGGRLPYVATYRESDNDDGAGKFKRAPVSHALRFKDDGLWTLAIGVALELDANSFPKPVFVVSASFKIHGEAVKIGILEPPEWYDGKINDPKSWEPAYRGLVQHISRWLDYRPGRDETRPRMGFVMD